MTVEILGRREDQRLEFKSRRALEEPGTIAKEVVGMLNAGGGEIWIGVEDEKDIAVAVDPVPDPERAKARLLDHLVDAVEPSPTADEVTVEVAPTGADPGVLVVRVRPAGRASGRIPHAFRKGGGWHFFRRVGARNHPMSRQEIFGQSAGGDEDPVLTSAYRTLEKARETVRDSGVAGLWVGVQPGRPLELDVQAEWIDELASDPSITGNRDTGWHFARTSRRPKPTRTGIEWGLWLEDRGAYVCRAEVDERGGLRFWTSLEGLQWKGEEREIWPLILLEYPISALRIARRVYEGRLCPDDQVLADLALFGVAGWGLRRGTVGDFFLAEIMARVEESDLFWEPVRFSYRDIEESPDRCGFRLVRRVYQAFGWRELEMPRQYDRKTGRLVLPE